MKYFLVVIFAAVASAQQFPQRGGAYKNGFNLEEIQKAYADLQNNWGQGSNHETTWQKINEFKSNGAAFNPETIQPLKQWEQLRGNINGDIFESLQQKAAQGKQRGAEGQQRLDDLKQKFAQQAQGNRFGAGQQQFEGLKQKFAGQQDLGKQFSEGWGQKINPDAFADLDINRQWAKHQQQWFGQQGQRAM